LSKSAPPHLAAHSHLNIPEWAPSAKLPISPLAGEMPGKAEGGAVPPVCQTVTATSWLFPVGNGLNQELAILPTPSVLPDISPARGEIGCSFGFR